MSPDEFIAALARHYSKRHDNAESHAAWLKEMIDIFRGTDSVVLAKAYELIRDEHEERAFPLPATLKRFIGRAADLAYPDHVAWKPLTGAPHVAPDPESVQRVRALVADLKGKLAMGGKPAVEPEQLPDVSRPAFEKMQRESPNRALHMTEAGFLSDLSKRMSGDK